MIITKIVRLVCLMTVFLLAACSFSPNESPAPIQTVPPVEPPVPTPTQPELPPSVSQPLPQPPKIQSTDWRQPLQPLVQQILAVSSVPSGSLLFVNPLQNKTNGALSTVNMTQALLQLLQHNPLFRIATSAQAAQAKQALGIAEGDTLGTRSKAIALARYMQAPYLLYTEVQGDNAAPTIQMQLMLTNTGEIVWTGSQVVKH